MLSVLKCILLCTPLVVRSDIVNHHGRRDGAIAELHMCLCVIAGFVIYFVGAFVKKRNFLLMIIKTPISQIGCYNNGLVKKAAAETVESASFHNRVPKVLLGLPSPNLGPRFSSQYACKWSFGTTG